jgi:hypothetical protein
MKTTYAIFQSGGRYHQIIALNLPTFGEPGFRWNALSLAAFKNNELKRSFPHLYGMAHKDPAPWRFYLEDEQEYQLRQDGFDSVMNHLNKPVPERGDGNHTLRYETQMFDLVHFDSVFEFYEYIGYDYKKKKYYETNRVESWIEQP